MNTQVVRLALGLLGLTLVGCGGSGTYRLLGNDVLEVSASDMVLSRAVSDASHSLAQNVSTQPAQAYYPSLGCNVRTWKIEQVTELTRVSTSFKDQAGRQVRVDEIQRRGRPTLVFVGCEGGDPLAVVNAIVQPLETAGVRPAS